MRTTIAAIALGPLAATAQPPTIHVTVALCDNVHQGIVPVPAALGNGQDPGRNLYWGAAYGVRTWFDRSKAWERVKLPATAPGQVLERCVWRHHGTGAILVADAWDGRHIEQATGTFLDHAAGHSPVSLSDGNALHRIGGGADLLAYVGHDGLMDFAAPAVKPPADNALRRTIILACISQRFFREPLRTTGASPLLWTTGLMAPEAYTLEAALNAWLAKGDDASVREAAANAYHTWQKCGLNAARRLLVTGW
jgi:hypothetical protein